MKDSRKSIGSRGEELAVEFCERNGYVIVERNYRTRYAEADIIALKDDVLFFIEVKTLRKRKEEVRYSDKQRNRLRSLAESYLAEKGLTDKQVGFAVMFISGNPESGSCEIELIHDNYDYDD